MKYSDALDTTLNSLLDATHFSQKEILIMSVCLDPEEYNTCAIPNSKNSNQMSTIESGVLNVGVDVSKQFSCLVNPYYPQDLINIGDPKSLYD